MAPFKTRSSAVAEGLHDLLCQLKPCKMLHNRSSNCIRKALQHAMTFKVIRGH